MSTMDELKFDACFAEALYGSNAGGRYLPQSFHADDREGMAHILAGLQKFSGTLGHGWSGWNRKFRVHTDYVNQARPNAYAWRDQKDEELFFIGISAGLALKSFGLWTTICACTDVLDGSSSQLHTPPGIDIFEEFRKNSMMGEWHILPRDQERIALAHCMSLIALEWLFFHELGHIVHGHVGRKFNRDGPLETISEFQVGRSGRISFEDHMMECDADEVATWWCLDNWARQRSPLLAASPFKMELDDYSHLLFFIGCILQHAFGNMNTQVEEVAVGPGSTHPHGEVRIDFIHNAIHYFYETSGLVVNYNRSNLGSRLWTALTEARDAVAGLAKLHTPFPNLFRENKEGKPIKEVALLYNHRLIAEARPMWSSYRLNPEPTTELQEELKRALDTDATALMAQIGQELLPPGAAAPSLQELLERARKWMDAQKASLVSAVCASVSVRRILRLPDKAERQFLLGLAVVDVVAGVAAGVSPAVVTALLIKEGVHELCDQQEKSDK